MRLRRLTPGGQGGDHSATVWPHPRGRDHSAAAQTHPQGAGTGADVGCDGVRGAGMEWAGQGGAALGLSVPGS